MPFQTQKHIDTDALTHNLSVVRKYAPKSKVLAMVKADGYGHGLLLAAKAFASSDALGVAILSEALQLRDAGIALPIVVMRGFDDQSELGVMIERQITPVIHRQDQVECLMSQSLEQPIDIWLKVDTGMRRLGFSVEQAKACYDQLSGNNNIRSIVVLTHFANADEVDGGVFTQQQIQNFNQLDIDSEKSLANSAAILRFPHTHQDWVRPGIMLYGASPFNHQPACDFDLKPAMIFASQVIAVKNLKQGDVVGYGSTYVCPQDSQIAIIGAGYGDGYPRHAKNGAPVLIAGKQCPLVGRVSMDMIAVDVSGVRQVKVGDDAILWGNGLPAETVAASSETIAYELFTSVGALR